MKYSPLMYARKIEISCEVHIWQIEFRGKNIIILASEIAFQIISNKKYAISSNDLWTYMKDNFLQKG